MITSTAVSTADKCPINYIFVSLHFTFSAFPMIIQISVSRFRFVNALSIATLLPSLRGKHYFHPLLLSLASWFRPVIRSSTLLPSAIFTSVIMARKEISSWIYSNIQTVTCQFPPSCTFFSKNLQK